MQIVINIHEKDLECLKRTGRATYSLISGVLKGTVLPKGHGNLIDVNELEPDTEWNDYEDGFISYSHNQIKCANVIIEADAE